MRVLVACEFSGITRDAFARLGHDAISCDFRPSETPVGAIHLGATAHYQCDVRELLKQEKWDLLIAHPPCTHLALSGARWLTDHWVKRKNKPARWYDGTAKREAQRAAVELFSAVLDCRIPRRCIENPMSMASRLVAPKSQTIHPWQFGHPEQKTTWLWLRNLPPLVPTHDVYTEMMALPKAQRERVWSMTPGPQRERDRSRSFAGIASAMAEQWGAL